MQNDNYSSVFKSFPDEGKWWALDYSSESNGVKPYQKIKSYKDLDVRPEKDFFAIMEFYSLLKNEIIEPFHKKCDIDCHKLFNMI